MGLYLCVLNPWILKCTWFRVLKIIHALNGIIKCCTSVVTCPFWLPFAKKKNMWIKYDCWNIRKHEIQCNRDIVRMEGLLWGPSFLFSLIIGVSFCNLYVLLTIVFSLLCFKTLLFSFLYIEGIFYCNLYFLSNIFVVFGFWLFVPFSVNPMPTLLKQLIILKPSALKYKAFDSLLKSTMQL